MGKLSLGVFRVDVTPPVGHPLCAGWTNPAVGVSDPLYALGVVLVGDDDPIVLCAVDWCEISNGDHIQWREALAKAADTIPDRVAVQCIHQHNAPWPDHMAEELVIHYDVPMHVMDIAWCERALERVADAVRGALHTTQPVTHIDIGQAKVEKVASNRRVLGADGRVKAVRWTACKDPAVRAEPEGLIDPYLKTVRFWNGERKLAALHYYAVHPCSYYGDGWVTSDFVGLARERRTREEDVPHIYFTGCAGNVTPGKYNDGSPENRPVLTDRIYRAMVASEEKAERVPADELEWRVKGVVLPPREDLNEPTLLAKITDPAQSVKERIRAALQMAYLRRSSIPIPLTCLHIGGRVCLLHLPGEAFVEYQLFAQEQRSDLFVAVASYGDCGTGYIPLAKSFAEGGYEPTDAFVSPEAEGILKEAIASLVQ